MPYIVIYVRSLWLGKVTAIELLNRCNIPIEQHYKDCTYTHKILLLSAKAREEKMKWMSITSWDS